MPAKRNPNSAYVFIDDDDAAPIKPRKRVARASKPVARRSQVRAKPKKGYYLERSQHLRPYFGRAGSVASGYIGSLIGGPAGAAVGSRVGRQMGNLTADLVRTLTGYGDYQIKKNVYLSGQPPQVNHSNVPGGGCIICHREYLGDVVSGSANTFNLVSYPIVPSSDRTFPWLSQIATNFQEWVPHGIVFEFRTMSADALNSTNTSLGQVIMATNYNSELPNYQSKGEMENSEFSNSVKPSASCLHMIECARSATVLSELYTNSESSDDKRFSQLGNFQIATNGMQAATVNVGELWISYTIELRKPILYDALGLDVLFMNAYGTSGIDVANPLGTSLLTFSAKNTMTPFGMNSTSITFYGFSNPKRFMILLSYYGTRTASLDRPALAVTNGALTSPGVVFQSVSGFTSVLETPDTNAASASVTTQDVWFVDILGNGQNWVLSFSGGTPPAAVQSVTLVITEIPYNTLPTF